MKKYEYIQVEFEWGDLEEINQLSSIGFRVVTIDRQIDISQTPQRARYQYYALMEREIE